MKRGHFNVSIELTHSPEWIDIENEINKVFRLEAREKKPFGVIEFHGTSDLFEESTELSSPKYDCLFKTVNGKPMFDKFQKS